MRRSIGSPKLTENEVINHLSAWLENQGWQIVHRSLGHSRGIDIKAEKKTKTLLVEAKGARGDEASHVTTRSEFNSSQIKTHLGKAIVRVLELRHRHPKAIIAIAQPDDEYLKNCIKDVVPELKKVGIRLFWVSPDRRVTQE